MLRCCSWICKRPVNQIFVFSSELLENTDAVLCPTSQCFLGTAAGYLLDMLTCALLMTLSHSEGHLRLVAALEGGEEHTKAPLKERRAAVVRGQWGHRVMFSEGRVMFSCGALLG